MSSSEATSRGAAPILFLMFTSVIFSCFFNHIHFALLRWNYFSKALPWAMAVGCTPMIILVSCFLCWALTLSRWRGVRVPMRIGGIAAPFISFFCLFWVAGVHDPSEATRSHQQALNAANGIAFRYHHATAADSESGKTQRTDFTYAAKDLSILQSSSSPELIIAYSRRIHEDTGVVDYNSHLKRYIYYGRSRAVAFADGHADLVLLDDFPKVMAANNTVRAKLGLAPMDDDGKR